MLSVEDWAEIRRLHRAEEMPIKVIARTLGVARNTVRAALAADGPPKYARTPAGSAVDAFEALIREQLQAVPTMPATVIAERVGWTRGLTVFKERVRELRPAYLPPDPASRTTYEAGELAQFDFWFPPIELPVGFGQSRTAKRLPVMTMVSGYSRFAGATLIPSRDTEDLYAGWWRLLSEQLGAVPRTLVWDGEGAVGRWRARAPELTLDCQAFRGVLGVKVYICKPADPEAKGMLERFHDYLERSFLPGRRFTSPADFNTQLAGFLVKANARRMRVLGCRPDDRVGADRAAMLALPPVAPEVGWRATTRLPRDHYIRLDSNDYSVHPSVIGRRVEVHADLDRVWVTCEGTVVADHARVWAWHQTITDFEHAVAAKLLRRGRADLLRPVPDPGSGDQVEVRPLGTYDAAFGLDGLDDELDGQVS
ncbi:IS21 family transposase [Humibacillus xanthopallidus]|uniref:IS21 family transposase n=2 Tax=Humibacillus xanthopallidus TaxID=412689 RepID=UPI001151D390|nr:IS21 family transposase [Humibacillus xanthopallidus]